MKSIYILIIANLLPLVGVVYFDWSLGNIMPLYWFENVVIGYFNYKKMKIAELPYVPDPQSHMRFKLNGKDIDATNSTALPGFFAIHFGIFTFVHGIFVATFFFVVGIDIVGLLLGMISLCVSHMLSYRINYIGNEEYKANSVAGLFWQPYKRVVVLHIAIIAGAFVVSVFESQLVPLVVFILIKIAIDAAFHVLEHKQSLVARI